jgi:hypothetical protein
MVKFALIEFWVRLPAVEIFLFFSNHLYIQWEYGLVVFSVNSFKTSKKHILDIDI